MPIHLQNNSLFEQELYLSPKEQDLLLTALNSNKPAQSDSNISYSPLPASGSRPSGPRSNSNPQRYDQSGRSSLDHNDHYTSPLQQVPGSAGLGGLEFDSPLLDLDVDDGVFDWDINGDQMIGSLPGTSVDDEDGDLHDKRKMSDDDLEDNEGGGKRREGEDRTGKKPGRKPLTSEPTSKRKAQNRAAQRAFRERKERHLKELETKVEDLEKASESANHENGRLRDQVDRLQTELKEYRKRLSMNSNSFNRSPPLPSSQSMSSKAGWDFDNNFQFEFPMFGTSTSAVASESPQAKTNSSRRTTNGSQTGIMSGIGRGNSMSSAQSKTLPEPNRSISEPKIATQGRNPVIDLGDLFSPTELQSLSRNNSADYIAYANNYQRKKSSSAEISNATTNTNSAPLDYNTASPSASSVSQNGFVSSCVTTPETSAESPRQHKAGENGLNEGERAFCADFQTACGTKENPVPQMMMQSDQTSASSTTLKNPGTDFQSFDWLASQNGGAFDPILFGDYREPQENIMNGDFGAFFNDAFPTPEFLAPSTSSLETTLPRKRDLMQEIDDQQAGKEPEVVPGDRQKQFLTCNMLWDRMQRSEKVQSGEVDMDDLCTQLKAKAKCSGSGAVIEQKDVDAILGPPPQSQKDFLKHFI